MFSDVFSNKQAFNLLKGKKIWFIGSSNMRAIYKDVLWLTQNDCLATQMAFKIKNEPTYCGDKLLSNDTLHNGRNYLETREYKDNNIYLFFHFITRLYQDHFIELIKSIKPETAPDIIFLNSCLWDLSRWGPDGPKQFRENIMRTMRFLKSELPEKTRVIWKTSLPVSTSADGAIFVDEIKFIIPMLPWHILEANIYASTCADFFNYDTLDFHHYMRLQGHLRVRDGIHWSPIALRYLTNAFLTHLALCWGSDLPGHFKPSNTYLKLTTKLTVQTKTIEERVNKKANFFEKLFKKNTGSEKKKNKNGPLSGIKNKIINIRDNIFKRKKRNKKKIKTVAKQTNLPEVASSTNYFPNTYNNTGMNHISPLHRYVNQYQQQTDYNYYANNYNFNFGNYLSWNNYPYGRWC